MSTPPSVVIHDLDVLGTVVSPGEADTPLIIDPDAVLPDSIAPQRLQTIARRHSELIEHNDRIETT